MPKRHQHADVIHAWAEGADIEFRVDQNKSNYGSEDVWRPCRDPDWHENFEYRIKHEPDPVLALAVARLNVLAKMHEDGD